MEITTRKFIRVIFVCIIPLLTSYGCLHDKDAKSEKNQPMSSTEQTYQESKKELATPDEKTNPSDEQEDNLDKKIKAVDDFFKVLGDIAN